MDEWVITVIAFTIRIFITLSAGFYFKWKTGLSKSENHQRSEENGEDNAERSQNNSEIPVYQSLDFMDDQSDPHQIPINDQTEPVYQSLNRNTDQLDSVYHTLQFDTQSDSIYENTAYTVRP